MKRLIYSTLYIPIFVFAILLSCKKDLSDTIVPGNSVKPVANAGQDKDLILPVNSTILDGSLSTVAGGRIISYLWNKISGPETFNIEDATAVKTVVKNLVEGVYQFELTVTGDNWLKAKDTIQVTVNAPGTIPGKVSITLTEVGSLQYGGQTVAVQTPGKIVFVELPASPPNLYLFDIATKQIKTVAAPLAGNYISVVASGDKVFMAGGNNSEDISDVVHFYDISEDKWYSTRMTEGRTNMGAGAVGNKVLFAAGINDGFWGESSDVDIYDLTTGQWSKSSISTPKIGMAVVTSGNKVYFAGGTDYLMPGGPFNSIDIYNNDNGAFYEASFNTLWGQVAGLALGDKIYWAGVDRTGTYGKAEVWNTSTKDINVFPLSYARKSPAVVMQNQFVLFGTPNDYWWTSAELREYSDKVDIYNTTTGEWLVGTLPYPVQNAAYISVDNTIYLAGGNLGSKVNNNKIYTLSW